MTSILEKVFVVTDENYMRVCFFISSHVALESQTSFCQQSLKTIWQKNKKSFWKYEKRLRMFQTLNVEVW